MDHQGIGNHLSWGESDRLLDAGTEVRQTDSQFFRIERYIVVGGVMFYHHDDKVVVYFGIAGIIMEMIELLFV